LVILNPKAPTSHSLYVFSITELPDGKFKNVLETIYTVEEEH